MTGSEILRRNGDFIRSPLIETVRNLHCLFSSAGVPYAVVGGMAVVRSGAVRTTVDVDILTERAGWERLRRANPEGFELGTDHGVDRATGVDIDVLFPGDEWEMVIPVPEPDAVKELDDEVGAFYIDLVHLIEWKTAVYMKKRAEDGIELAAKDLADVVALAENNPASIDADFIGRLHPSVRAEYANIAGKVKKY